LDAIHPRARTRDGVVQVGVVAAARTLGLQGCKLLKRGEVSEGLRPWGAGVRGGWGEASARWKATSADGRECGRSVDL
jgi:hypothetical protein